MLLFAYVFEMFQVLIDVEKVQQKLEMEEKKFAKQEIWSIKYI